MNRVTGIGGVFFVSEDPNKLQEWYIKHLGVPFVIEGNKEKYVVFDWETQVNNEKKGYTLWGPMKKDSIYFRGFNKNFMFNFTVDDLEEVLSQLRNEGVHVFDKIEQHSEGKFGWILDPEGNKIELWEPPKKKKKK